MDWTPSFDSEDELIFIEPQQDDVAFANEELDSDKEKKYIPRPAYQLERVNKRREKQKELEKLSPSSRAKLKVIEFVQKISSAQNEEDEKTMLENFDKGTYVERETVAMMRLAGLTHTEDRPLERVQRNVAKWPVPKRIEINHNGRKKIPVLYDSAFFALKATSVENDNRNKFQKEKAMQPNTTKVTCDYLDTKPKCVYETQQIKLMDLKLDKSVEKTAEEQNLDELLLRFESGPLCDTLPALKKDLDIAKEYIRTNIRTPHIDKHEAKSTGHTDKLYENYNMQSNGSLYEYAASGADTKDCGSKIKTTRKFMIDDEVVTFCADNYNKQWMWKPNMNQVTQIRKQGKKPVVMKKSSEDAPGRKDKNLTAPNSKYDFKLITEKLHELKQLVSAKLDSIEQPPHEEVLQELLENVAAEISNIKSMVSVHLQKNLSKKPSTNEKEQIKSIRVSIDSNIFNSGAPSPPKTMGYDSLENDDTSEDDQDYLLHDEDDKSSWISCSSREESADISDTGSDSEVFYSFKDSSENEST